MKYQIINVKIGVIELFITTDIIVRKNYPLMYSKKNNIEYVKDNENNLVYTDVVFVFIIRQSSFCDINKLLKVTIFYYNIRTLFIPRI